MADTRSKKMPNKLTALDNVHDNYTTVLEQSIVTYTSNFEIIAVLVEICLSLTFFDLKTVVVLHDGSRCTKQ